MNEINNQAAQTMPLPAPNKIAHDLLIDLRAAAAIGRPITGDEIHEIEQRMIAALSQTAGVAEDHVAIPKHYAENVGYAAAMLENSASVIDKHNAPALRNLMSLMLAAAPAASGWNITDHSHEIGFDDGLDGPAASGGEDDPYAFSESRRQHEAACRDRMNVSGVFKAEPPSAASVSERARELLAAEYRSHGWHEDAGRLCMGGDPTSFVEDDALRVIDRLIEQGDEDAHVITELGRLLACIAVILKGPEPAGTAWSYHDLPELVASALSEPRQVAAEMKAWARTRMAEQQSSRRDRMMVSEWAKRLLPESSFPIKDFDVEGMSITKEAAREAVKRVALEQALTQQRGEDSDLPFATTQRVVRALLHLGHGVPEGQEEQYARSNELVLTLCSEVMASTTPQPGAEALRELVRRWRECAKAHEIKADRPEESTEVTEWHAGYGECATFFADELESLLARGGK